MTMFISRFIAIADAKPDAAAIEDNGRIYTYGWLAARMRAVSAHLQQKGFAADTPVAVALEKSAAYIAGILGIWHAGAAFVPLPPSLPKARRQFISQDAGIRAVLTAAEIADLSDADSCHAAETRQDDLAYIIYTSGSTGAPKGVAVTHRGILNFLDAQIAAFGTAAETRYLFYLSINFDAALSDIGVTLLAGGTLVIPPPDVLRDGNALTALLHTARITHADLPPALLNVLDPLEMPESFTTLIIGGEACPPETVRQWARTRRIINVYGPTETTVCTSLALCDAQSWDKPLLGTPFPGVDYLVREEELYIGGVQLARGYVGLPDLTAQKFILLDGKRFYRTGDRVRTHANGDIEFLGRLDRQFKLRGQLVEPDEVEARLRSHPAIARAAVLKRKSAQSPDAPDILAAAIQEKFFVDDKTLTAYLSETLPAWMIPQTYLRLPHLPETPSGKTDYAALAALPLPAPAGAVRETAETTTEKTLQRLWADVLKHDDFGATDDFYTVGGDSLALIRLTLAAARQGINLPPEIFATHRSIRTQALAVDDGGTGFMPAALLRALATPDAALQDLIKKAEDLPPPPTQPVHILLTGATGFLGSRLLRELLMRTDAHIHCLVRAADAATGLQRLRDAFVCYAVPDDIDWSRVSVACGDLSREAFGMDAAAYDALTAQIDTVFHVAARVNMVESFATLAEDNFYPLARILRFALTGRRKTVHHASTLSVFVSSDQNSGVLREDDRLENISAVHGGYAQTKFAAEWLLLQVPPAVLPVYHYRLGLITGDTATGTGPARDFLALFARGQATLGFLPEGFDQKIFVDVTPVDYAARAMAALLQQAPAGIYHIANSRGFSLGDLAAALARRGYPQARLPTQDWYDVLRRRNLDTAESAAMMALCRCFPGVADNMAAQPMDLFQATGVTFDTAKADAWLLPLGIACPPATPALADLYVSRFLPRGPAKICLFGPESTGKTTLAERLARHYNAPLAPEYAKRHIEGRNGDIAADDIPLIAAGQMMVEKQARQNADDLVICDTDLLTTTIWSNWLFGSCPAWVTAAAQATDYDLTLLMDIDTPWVDDIHRYLPDDRENFLARCRAELDAQGRKYVLLSGSAEEKFDRACRLIDDLRRGWRQDRDKAA